MNNIESATENSQTRSLQPKFRAQFQKQVLVKLLEILEISKQEQAITKKAELQKHCDEIGLLGRKAHIAGWGEVLATAKRVLNNDHDNYQQIIKIIVQEVKKITELVVEDKCNEIVISPQLKELAELKIKAEKPKKMANIKDKLDTYSRKSTSSHKNHRELPKVDAQDLNSLADVFEVSNELEDNWQQGELISSDELSDTYHGYQQGKTAENDELNDLFAEELSLIQINPKKTRKKRTLGSQETVMLFGEDFSFQKSNQEDKEENQKLEPNPFDENDEIHSLDMDDFSFDDEFSLSSESEPLGQEEAEEDEEDLELSISKMFEEDFSLEEENQKKDKKKSTPGKDTMLLFGEDFSFDDTDLETEPVIDPKITKVNSGEVFGDELSLNLKPKSRKAKKLPLGSKDTTNLFGKDFSFDEHFESEEARQKNALLESDLDINDLFGDQDLETEKKQEEFGNWETDIDDLFDEEDLEGEKWSTSKTADAQTDVDDLFGEGEATEIEIESLFSEENTSSENEFDDLFASLEEGETSADLDLDMSDFLTEDIGDQKKEISYFYEQLEELEDLISKTEAIQAFKFEDLVALIEAPALESGLDLITQVSQPDLEDEDFADLEAMLQQSSPNVAGAGTAINSMANKSGFEQTMKVPVKQLDNLNNLMGELVVNKNSLEQDQERMRQFLENLLNHVGNLSEMGARMQDLYERTLLESSLLAAREGVRHGNSGSSRLDPSSNSTLSQDYDPLEMDRFTGFHLLSQEMIELIVRVRESSSDIQFLVDETEQVSRNLRQITSQLQEGLNKSRMVPFAETADRMRAAVRRVSVQLKKQAELIIEGRDVLIDKMIAEHLFDPMTHLINNALTHGVETPSERESKGKPAVGKITMGAYVQGNQTIITVSDDGAGINVNIVKRKAVEKGLISQYQSTTMTDQQAFDLIFHAGFSTKEKADDFAGRGVGMDVVRTALNEIRGTVSIESHMGKGTTFTIRLPLMLTISKALCCLSAHHRIAFPMDGVEDMQDFFPAEIKTNDKGEKVIPWRNNLVPFKPLTELLKYNRQIGRGNLYGGKREDDMISIVILRSGGNSFAVQVDQVLGEQEIVIKQIQGPVPKSPGIAGATVLGDGRIMGIVDVLELFDIAQGRIRHEVGGLWDAMVIEPAESEVRTEPMVLIVDDSITVRELLSMTFNKAGYRVEQARDGQDAWDKLRSGLPCDMVFCDIEMPRMDGLELLSKIIADEELNHLPVAMLTSRGAEKHKQMAAQLGASAYFTKPYLEEALLEGAARMMKGDVLLSHSSRKPGKKKAKSQQRLEEEQQQPLASGIVSSINDIPTVLIIDDSVVVRELLSSTFQNAGYQVEQARDGQEAWDKLNDGLYCDVVFCDIEMPRMNGLDLLTNLQTDEKLSQIPVAMLTSRGAERHRRMAADKGAKGYFTKPYMDEVLLDAAQRLMRGEVLIPVSS